MSKELVGKKCPNFEGECTNNKKINNKNLLGKNFIIYFIQKIALLGAPQKDKILEITSKIFRN